MFQVKNNSKSDRLPKKRESSLEENANTILRIYLKKYPNTNFQGLL